MMCDGPCRAVAALRVRMACTVMARRPFEHRAEEGDSR